MANSTSVRNNPQILRTGRNLHKSLSDILAEVSDVSMLPWFVQYMETCEAVHLLEFWFTVESFEGGGDCSVTTPPADTALRLIKQNSKSDGQPAQTDGRGCASKVGNHKKTEGSGSSTHGKLEVNGDLPVVVLNIPENSENDATLRDGTEGVLTDAVEIYTTYVGLNAIKQVHIGDDLRLQIESKLCPENGLVERDCFREAKLAVFDLMENKYYPGFLNSPPFAQYQLHIISTNAFTLLDVLQCPNTSLVFREFLEQDGCINLLEFWYMAHYFTQDIGSRPGRLSSEQDIDHAIAIYIRFISLQATNPIGLSHKKRQEVELRLSHSPGPRWDTFVQASEDVLIALEHDHFESFKHSQLFLRYQNQLLSTVSEDNRASSVYRCSSVAGSVSSSRGGADIDDPDELWKKPKLLFRFGYVDEMGTFISEANLESFLRSKQGKYLSEKKFMKIVGREPSYARSRPVLLKLAEQIIVKVKTSFSEFGTETDLYI